MAPLFIPNTTASLRNITGDLSRNITGSRFNSTGGHKMPVAFTVFGYCTIGLVVFGFVGNVLMIGSMFHGKLYRHTTNQLLINLFLVGAIYAALAMPAAAYSTIRLGWHADNGSCRFFGFMALSGCFVSCLNHAAIAVARYLAVVHIGSISKRIQDRVGLVMLVLTWLMPYVVFTFPFFGVGAMYGYKKSVERCQYSSVEAPFVNAYRFIFQIAPIVVMCICYTLIVFKVCLVRTAVGRNKQKDTSLRFKHRFSVELGIAKRTGTVAVFFIVCFLPSVVWSYIPGSIVQDLTENLAPSLYLLMWFGVTCSYLAYLPVNPDLRYAIRSLLKRLRLWPTKRASVGPVIIAPTDFPHNFTETRSKSTRLAASPRPRTLTEHTTGSVKDG
ncbi:melatonin receptor type 1B-A-like [Paramacrobiotus metropolitanus]|uniref:melatonin receptor type 1B-A-like n=1 Tax=Paramacrobiotus metropolitanus TaxID=2943436 RepID=UPI002446072C|nr:melatonin receptor type 1B-A-like [Paramacrobiotus metropolitanus]